MITFNNIPTTVRTVGAHAEIDNSKALQGLVANPHRVLILGQKKSTGTATKEAVYAIPNELVADGYFGVGSILARMCRAFKNNNPNTELHAMAMSDASCTGLASGCIRFTGSATADGNFYLMVGGVPVTVPVTSAWSATDIASATASAIQTYPQLCVIASLVTSTVLLKAQESGLVGNYYDVRANYYEGQSNPTGITPTISALEGGVGSPNIAGVWAVIDDEQYHHIVQAYTDDGTLDSLEAELEDRFGPLIAKQGFGYTAARATAASCTTLGNSRNSPHHAIMGVYDSPTGPEVWAAAMCAVCSAALNADPGRPVHTLKLKDVLPPPMASRFTRAERDVLLYDGISTYTVDSGGNVLLEQVISTYQKNALNDPDASYLYINTLMLLMEIRYQWVTRMGIRFIVPRFKLAADTFPVQPGSFVATPKTVKQETIALFTELYRAGYIDKLDDFVKNVIVELDSTNPNRVNVVLPVDLINQFQQLAGKIQYVL